MERDRRIEIFRYPAGDVHTQEEINQFADNFMQPATDENPIYQLYWERRMALQKGHKDKGGAGRGKWEHPPKLT
jgi:hypothetical protein